MTQAFLVGATGEVGKHVLAQLLASPQFSRVVVLSRRPIDYDGPKKDALEVKIIDDFNAISEHNLDLVKGSDFVFCTLGSTRAKAGSAEAFENIDHGYTIKIANLAKKAGCKWFGVVTAVGADPHSSFLYPRVKGRIEEDLKALKFPNLAIFRPGFLLGRSKSNSAMESFALFLVKGINYVVPDRFAISTERVAKAMIAEAVHAKEQGFDLESPQVQVWDNKAIADSA